MSKGHVIVLPNISYSWLSWEADMISITRNDYLYEYEIKTTASDFKADFKKPKHRAFKNPNISRRVPNYFIYVALIEAIPVCIPDYAGLYQVIEAKSSSIPRIQIVEIKKPDSMTRNKPITVKYAC
jgi:hypothetical protein